MILLCLGVGLPAFLANTTHIGKKSTKGKAASQITSLPLIEWPPCSNITIIPPAKTTNTITIKAMANCQKVLLLFSDFFISCSIFFYYNKKPPLWRFRHITDRLTFFFCLKGHNFWVILAARHGVAIVFVRRHTDNSRSVIITGNHTAMKS